MDKDKDKTTADTTPHPNHQGGETEKEKGTTTEAATSQDTTTSLGTPLGTLPDLNLREDQAW